MPIVFQREPGSDRAAAQVTGQDRRGVAASTISSPSQASTRSASSSPSVTSDAP